MGEPQRGGQAMIRVLAQGVLVVAAAVLIAALLRRGSIYLQVRELWREIDSALETAAEEYEDEV
jgi:archaellum component FlaF (FlaF/FlaG flagellin family)